MKAVRINEEYYSVIKEMTERQAGEFVKKLCARIYEGKPIITRDPYLKGAFVSVEKDIAISKQNSLNARKALEKNAERQREQRLANLGFALGSALAVAHAAAVEDGAGLEQNNRKSGVS